MNEDKLRKAKAAIKEVGDDKNVSPLEILVSLRELQSFIQEMQREIEEI